MKSIFDVETKLPISFLLKIFRNINYIDKLDEKNYVCLLYPKIHGSLKRYSLGLEAYLLLSGSSCETKNASLRIGFEADKYWGKS